MRAIYLVPILLVATFFARTSVAPGQERQVEQPKPQPIELSGRLHKPVKWTPQLELIPPGQIKRFDVKGKLIHDIEAGAFIRVRGVVRSYLHRGSTKENPSPFGAQWTVWLEVTDVQILDHPLDVLRERDD